MKEVFILSTGQILNGKTAGARRIMNIAKSLAAGNVNVFLWSLSDVQSESIENMEIAPGITSIRSVSPGGNKGIGLRRFIKLLYGFLNSRNGETVIYLYPSTFIFKDFIYLIYFKYLKRYRFFCEINELRSAIAFSATPTAGILPWLHYFLKSIKDYVIYKLNEYQVFLYDGIVVISRNLEAYFSNRSQKILRVPILCDADEIQPGRHPGAIDGTAFKICFAGYIKLDKEGFDTLFESVFQLNKVQNVEMFLYGILEQPDRIRIDQLSEKYQLTDKIKYMGNIDPALLQDEFVKYNLLILPRPLNKRTKYGFSTKLSEYLVSGVPVLLTDVSDNALFIKDNYNGFMIPPGSAQAMTEKILEIIENYNEKAGMIVENAYRTVREELDYRLFSNRYISFLFGVEDKASKPA
ncbi:MAG: glycosyltransferase [Bacteroidales bacterium]|nr:glycosyltransferase [Bacteroidales bacterium]